jgi:hypothetical protein
MPIIFTRRYNELGKNLFFIGAGISLPVVVLAFAVGGTRKVQIAFLGFLAGCLVMGSVDLVARFREMSHWRRRRLMHLLYPSSGGAINSIPVWIHVLPLVLFSIWALWLDAHLRKEAAEKASRERKESEERARLEKITQVLDKPQIGVTYSEKDGIAVMSLTNLQGRDLAKVEVSVELWPQGGPKQLSEQAEWVLWKSNETREMKVTIAKADISIANVFFHAYPPGAAEPRYEFKVLGKITKGKYAEQPPGSK